MQEPSPGNVQKKASTEIFFADYGKYQPANESRLKDPTPENKRVIDLYDPVDAMSLNRERDRVVVAGIRGVLQIIKIQNSKGDVIEPPSIVKDLDMRVYRKGKVNILYSAQNVKWNLLYDQYIATTSSNGSIVCWNVSRRNKSVFKSHERSATCLDWHASTPYILISGSRDCSVKSYDMRVKDSHQLTFTDRNCESIRDVQMCKAPGFDDYFFTGDDGGVLRLWDLRQTKRWIFQKVAHRSFVSTLSLNPHDRTLVATGGGRDKMVKIWEWTGPELNRVSVVETTAPLGRVVWRPDKPYHLATCASVNETTVHVWDVRRPYLPYVTYDEHRDSVTDACWPSNNQDVFLTCGKDGLVVLHNIDSGHAPISFACDVAFDITPDGTMGLAVNSEIHAKNDAELEASLLPVDGKKKSIRPTTYESFNKPIKSLVAFGIPEALTHSLPPTTFYKIAEKYVIGGAEIAQLCVKNSKIARKAGLEHVAQTWRLVEALCEQALIQEEYDKMTAEEKARVIRAWAVRKKELAEEGRRWLANLNDHFRDDVKRIVTQRLENTQHVTAFLKYSSSSESEDGNDIMNDGENTREEIDRMKPVVDKNASKPKKRKKKKKKATAAPSDFYFGAGEANFKGGKQEVLHHNEFIGLRLEAYELRDVEKERRFFCKAKRQPTTAEEYDQIQREMLENEADFQAWSPMLEVYRLLLYHAEQGDMQTCATITMVCGKRLLDAVDFYTINGWITCYIEMLDRLELYIVIAKIRKYCTIESISSVSRENTTIQLAHADCDALIVNGRCSRCESAVEADCTVCRFPIIGMTYQCNVCGHCMHADHAYQWFQKSTACAFVGCPCTCGENMWPDIERTFIGNDEVRRGHRKFQHVEQSESSVNRVDASRLDTDSEESPEEDLEWSPGTETLKEKFGEIPAKDWNTPWAQHLMNLVNARNEYYKEKEEEEERREEEEDVDSDETQDDDPKVLSPITMKEAQEDVVRGTFMYNMQQDYEAQCKILGPTPLELAQENVKRRGVVGKFVAYDKRGVQRKKVNRQNSLEQIVEEDEDEYDDDDDPEEKKIRKKESEEKKETKNEQSEFINRHFKSEFHSAMELSQKSYIKSIPPIGVRTKRRVRNKEQRIENDRTTSPTLTDAVRKHLASLNQNIYESSSDEEIGNGRREVYPYERRPKERLTEREGKVKKEPKKVSYAEKALRILNMTKDELKKRKAKKQKARIRNQYYELFHPGTYKKIEVSSDEFTVSSLSDSSQTHSTSGSTSSFYSQRSKQSEPLSSGSSASELFIPVSEPITHNVSEGYRAECESDSTCHEELSAQPVERLPTPQATGDVYLKPESPTPEVVPKYKKYQKRPPASSDSELFSSDEEDYRAPSRSTPQDAPREDDDEPFFPMIDDVPSQSNPRHPWETEKQYRNRLVKEREEDEEEERERERERQAILEAEREAQRKREEEAIARAILLSKHTPVMRELARRKRRIELRNKLSSLPKPFAHPMEPLKRVKFTAKDYDEAMRIALENTNPDPECDINDVSDYEEFVKEQEVCIPCQNEVRENKKEKEYVQWLKNVSEENQMFFAKSLSSTCSVFQLSHLDSYITDVEKAKRTAAHLVEFIKMFYFIKWEDLLFPDNEFMLKEVYDLWLNFRKKRPRVCRTHYRDYQFKFFASSIATKMKQYLLMEETTSVRRSLLSYDWLHMKPCVNTLDDDPNLIDEMMDTVVYSNPKWSNDEKKAANSYWDMFGDVPVHIQTSDRIVVPPASEDHLEILDDVEFFTKKMIKNAMYNARNYDINLSYTKKKKPADLFRVQDRSKKVLNQEWQMRLDKMINETRNLDISKSSFRVNPYNKLIYTSDEKHPWPVCQFDMGDHYVTVQPMISKRYEELKARVRRKFTFRRGAKAHRVSKHVEITTDELRKLPSFKKFEPKLHKAAEFKKMMSKHFKVVDRAIVHSHHELYPIMEEDDEVDLIVHLLENHPHKAGKRRLDPEDVFAERRDFHDKRDREAYIMMMEDQYRRQLENTERMEAEKMKIIRKHWMPELRKKITVARKVMEIGRLVYEEEVRMWMEYQYELSFARRTFRKKSWITRKQMKNNVPTKWHDAIDKMDFNEPVSPPRFAKPLPPLKMYEYQPGPPAFNSSSDDEDYDEDDPEKPEDDSFIQYETQPDLPMVAAKLQLEIKEQVELADELADDEWEYSDDSSVDSWFNNDTDDIVNRLINPDYVEEHMVIKERMRGPLGRKLWEILEERESPEPLTDDEEDTSFDLMIKRDREEKEKEEIELKEATFELDDVGDSDGKRRKELTKIEAERDYQRQNKRDERKNEVEQIRYAFKKFMLDHSYTSAPYPWKDEIQDAITCLHKNEIRRVGNRIHKEMRDEYELIADEDDLIADVIPRDENGLEYKLINFLLFQNNDESFNRCSKEVDECKKTLRPIQRYEMFFGREGTYKLREIGEHVMKMINIRRSFHYLVKTFGHNWRMRPEKIRGFIKLWWINSRNTLERFITCAEENIKTQDQIVGYMKDIYYSSYDFEVVRDQFDQLEIGYLLNDMVYVVDQYIDETSIISREAILEIDRKAFSTMDVWDWMVYKYGQVDMNEYLMADRGSISYASSVSDLSSVNKEEKPKSPTNSIEIDCQPTVPTEAEPSPVKIIVKTVKKESSESSDEYEGYSYGRRRQSLKQGKPNKSMMSHYSAVYNSLKKQEAEKKRKRDEELAKRTLDNWERIEREQRWRVEDMERKVHDYLMQHLAHEELDDKEEEYHETRNWIDIVEDEENFKDVPSVVMYNRKDMTAEEVLEMCGLPLSLDNQMFQFEMEECQSAATSVGDASEYAEIIEKGFESDEYEVRVDDIDEDAKSYSSVKHVLKHELHFQRDLECRRVPSCVVIFTPEMFFENPLDRNSDFKTWKRIIEASECPFTFNKLVMRERMLQSCRDTFRPLLFEQYLEPEEKNYSSLIEIFYRCFIIIVLDTELKPWDCRIVSLDDHSKPASDRISYLRKSMVENSQEHLAEWLRVNKIDMEVYSCCPVFTVANEDLTADHASQMSSMFIEEYIRDDWWLIKRNEGVKALDAIIRMPPPPAHKLDAYKTIFRPIYDAWYKVWRFENSQAHAKTVISKKFDAAREYIHKARMIINYAHQHYRMKRFDSLMSKDPTEFQLVDRSDVPSASLFDNLDSVVSKFCNEDSPHLDDASRQVLKDTLIQLATGKIPYFTANYFGGYDYSENVDLNQETEGKDIDRIPLMCSSADILPPETPDWKPLEMDDCEEEYRWLRSMYEETDINRRRFMAVLMFEIAQKSLLQFAPNVADFERGQKRFEHLLTLHGRQRPLLDMMLTKVRGTYFMPLDTNLFLYNSKLITFSEMVDSEIHPKEWKDRKVTFEDHRRQTPIDPNAMSDFLEMQSEDEDSESGSENPSETSSSLSGSTESQTSSKRSSRKSRNKVHREQVLMNLRSKPVNPDETFALEKRALGPKGWKVRRQINDLLENLADLDRNSIEAKVPAKKKALLDYITDLIVNNCDSAHWSWGTLKMKTKIGQIPPPGRMRPKHIRRILKDKTMYKPPKNYNPKDPKTDGRKWF